MMEQGERIFVSGEVKWGDKYCRVAEEGTVEEWKKGPYALVTIDYVDKDFGVCVHVKKKYIDKLNKNNKKHSNN